MLQIAVQQEYGHSANKVWAITGEFGGLKNWLPGIDACRVEGHGAADKGGNAVRIVDVFDGSVTKERLESFDAVNHTYSYSIIEAKGLDASNEYYATFTVTPLGDNRCRVDWSARFKLPVSVLPEKAERAKQKIAQMYTMCLQNLQAVLARG